MGVLEGVESGGERESYRLRAREVGTRTKGSSECHRKGIYGTGMEGWITLWQ